jgi:DNA-binding transcriptional MerR regulator
MAKGEYYTISELAKAVGLPLSTLKHWCSVNLLEPELTTMGGTRVFGRMAFFRAQEIKRLRQDERRTIAEVKEVLG